MKLCFLLLIIPLIHASASSYAQGITLSKKDASLTEVFSELRKQTNYDFVYTKKQLSNAKKVTISVKNASINDVLEICFKGQPLSYTIENKSIIIKTKQPSSQYKSLPPVRKIDTKGKVTDENGSPLVGATIKVKETTITTKTNDKGEFYLSNINENAVIIISYLGYTQIELPISTDLGIIKLTLQLDDLKEVEINAGYYTVKDRERTGSISKVTSETIGKQPVNNVLGALIGQIPGVQIQQTTGFSGGNFKINIRGQNSLRSEGNAPLYLIDGVPFPSTAIGSVAGGNIIGGGDPLSSLNPNDIETIEILKDADATAIYGSRGANGVVLITTKKGITGETSFQLNYYHGASKVPHFMKLLNTEQYLELRNEAFKNDNLTPQDGDYDLNGTWDKNRYTDWQRKLIGGTANSGDLQLSVSGGDNNNSFLLKVGKHRETTVLPIDLADNKYSALLNFTHSSLNNKFKANVSASYLLDKNRLIYSDPTSAALNLAPNAPLSFDNAGNLNWEGGTWNNPFANFRTSYLGQNNTLIANTVLSYQILKDLNLKVNLGYTDIKLDESTGLPIASFNPITSSKTGSALFSNSKLTTWIIEPQLAYHKQIGNGNLNLLIGTTFQKNKSEALVLNATGYTNDDMLGNIQAATAINVGSVNQILYKYNAVFGRINYELEKKYYINLTGRRDGSSRFGPGKQFANFAAIGVAWVFTEEDFIKNNLPFLSFGKFRASYGVTGSDQVGDYGYYDLWKTTDYAYSGSSGLYPANLFNPDYGWERNRKLEAALSLGFLEDRITTSISYYKNRSGNQLVGYPLSATTGFYGIISNVKAEVQNTGLEGELATKNISSKDLDWTTSFNISIPNNTLVAFPGIENTSYNAIREVGKSIYVQRSYRYLGIDNATGLYTFEDKNKDGLLNATGDYQSLVEISPRFYGGFQNGLRYKNWDLNVFVQFVKQTGTNYLNSFVTPGFLGNQPYAVLDRWRAAGDNEPNQQFTQTTSTAYFAYQNYMNSDRAVTDASFIRLKSVELSYKLPINISNKLKIRNLRVYIQGQNLLTITNYIGLDPETQGSTLPPLRTVAMGCQITL